MRRLALLTLFAAAPTATLLPACGPGKDPADTEGATATDGATDGATTGATGVSGTSGTTVVDPTGGPVTTTTEGSGTDSAGATDSETGVASNPATSNTETDTGLSDPDWQASCTAMCEHLIECDPEFGSLGRCVGQCVMDAMDFGRETTPACDEAILNFNLCIANEDCRTVFDAPCAAEAEAIEEACGDGDEACGVGVMPPANGNCGKSLTCPDEDLMFLCEGDTCTCFENDVETKSCPAAMICEGEDWAAALDAAALECCDFEL